MVAPLAAGDVRDGVCVIWICGVADGVGWAGAEAGAGAAGGEIAGDAELAASAAAASASEGASVLAICRLSSRYSFHSSIWTRSYGEVVSRDVTSRYIGERGVCTHPDNHPVPHQPRQSASLAPPPPEHASLLVRGHIDRAERDLVCLEDRFETRGRGDDVRGACC